MSLYTSRFLELIEASGLERTLPGREPALATAMGATVNELKAWLSGAPMSAAELALFEHALPTLTNDLPAPPA